jgi:hypothetical protein
MFLSASGELLLAQSSTAMPQGKAVMMVVFFGAVALFSIFCSFAPSSTLEKFAGVIGTSNPMVARAVCVMGALIGFFGAAAGVMSLMGMLD